MSQIDELLLHFKGCLSREDGDGMIDVPAWYVRGAIAALEAAEPPAPEPAGDVRAVSDNGKCWRIVPTDGDWEMVPIGHITARQAEAVCKRIEAALSATASAPGSGVRVRPLEWKQPEPDWWEVYDRTLQLGYEVNQRRDGSVRLRVPGETSFAIFAGSVEEAKAAAQADFEQRIRSALDASPSPTQGETR